MANRCFLPKRLLYPNAELALTEKKSLITGESDFLADAVRPLERDSTTLYMLRSLATMPMAGKRPDLLLKETSSELS